MAETVFEQSYPIATRVAAVRAAVIVALYRLPKDSRSDLEQEGLLELWRKRAMYDPCRASWKTFSERVVANKLSSLLRSAGALSDRRVISLNSVTRFAASPNGTDLRADVSRVLAGISRFDQRVAACLVDHSAAETTLHLGVSRATVYRAIGRLRVAFAAAGFTDCGRARRQEIHR